MSIVPDWMDSPYGIWADYGPWAGLGKTTHLALHPGMVQHRQAVLATLALNGNDDLDGFSTTYGADDEEGGGSSGSGSGNLFPGLATNVLLPRYADEFVLVYPFDGNSDHSNGAAVVVPWSLPSNGSAAFEVELPLGTTLGLRVGDGSLALRVFTADAVDPATGEIMSATSTSTSSSGAGAGAGGSGASTGAARLVLKGDDAGLDLAAIRLVAYHLEQRPADDPAAFVNVTASHVQFNSLFVAADCGASTSGLGQTGRGNGVSRRRQEEGSRQRRSACLAQLARRVAAADVSATTTTTTTSSSSSAAPFDQLTVRASVDVVDILSAAGSAGGESEEGPSEGGSVGRPERLELEVSRNLTCAEQGGFLNQTFRTQWNCLLDRRVNGSSVVPPAQLEVNGVAVVEPPSSAPPTSPPSS